MKLDAHGADLVRSYFFPNVRVWVLLILRLTNNNSVKYNLSKVCPAQCDRYRARLSYVVGGDPGEDDSLLLTVPTGTVELPAGVGALGGGGGAVPLS